ncbi:MAG: efflux RND transporter periplasmic adaptor subunit [Pseudomonadota bacterium]
MPDKRSIAAAISIGFGLVCASWAVYEAKHGGSTAPGTQASPAGARPGAPGGVAPVPVIIASVQQRAINAGIQAIGTANSNEAVSVTAKSTNMITAIRFSDGQVVEAGQVLVELDRNQVAADLAAASAAFEESRSQFNRSRDLVASAALSKSQNDQLEATMKSNEAKLQSARARLDDTYIRAPFAGRVGLRRVSLGTLINPGTVITTLDDISAIKVDFAVPESYVSELRNGQVVTARTNAWPGRDFTGKVVSVDSRVDPSTRAVTVRAAVPNGDSALRPGMFLTVLVAQDRRAGLVIPEEALVPEQARQFVYVIRGASVDKREVTLGRREPGFVEIADGLDAGDKVVIEGTLKLRDGVPVRDVGPANGAAATVVTGS